MILNFNRRVAGMMALAAIAAASLSTPAYAQGYPERPIKMIVPFAPGGSTDLIGRIVIEKAQEELGQPIVVENVAGAGTLLGLNQLAGSNPDGYTIGMTTSTAVLQPIYGNVRYDYTEALVPLAQFAVTPPMLAINAGSEWQSLEDVLAAAEAQPGFVKYGITGVGNSSHLGPAQLALDAGVEMPHVVFDGGSSLMTALLGGHIPAAAGSPVDYKDQISAGAVRGLVMFAAERSADPVLADIPTAQELGYDIEIASWTGVSAPADISEEVLQRLEAAFGAAMADEEVQLAIRDLGSDPEYLDSAEFAQRWSDAGDRWTAIVTDTGILELVQSQQN
ncbi:Bug family tripartite tricarboxylate transporter substrate binding protein [Pelagibacterium mangrovi]|uniref:Bug family tripartite tricarboxylate transporter substrate binding protein n=1 Tax=Pelagibacterium mangrovi TaxID=3119828 RepID=UPI002FCCB534